jgi:hypothetical protein
MIQKRYVEQLVALVSEHRFGQDGTEWFIMTGQVQLCWNDIEHDLVTICGPPGRPDLGCYDAIVEAYQAFCRGITIEGEVVSPEQAEVYHQHERKVHAIHQV